METDRPGVVSTQFRSGLVFICFVCYFATYVVGFPMSCWSRCQVVSLRVTVRSPPGSGSPHHRCMVLQVVFRSGVWMPFPLSSFSRDIH